MTNGQADPRMDRRRDRQTDEDKVPEESQIEVQQTRQNGANEMKRKMAAFGLLMVLMMTNYSDLLHE